MAIKPVRLTAGARASRSEFVLTARGVEGGGIWRARAGARGRRPLVLDLLPDRSPEDVARRLARPRGGLAANHLRRVLNLPPAKIALLRECAPESPRRFCGRWPRRSRPCLWRWRAGPPMRRSRPRAGPRAALDDDLMLRARPGVYCAGEMLDWDAPTGAIC